MIRHHLAAEPGSPGGGPIAAARRDRPRGRPRNRKAGTLRQLAALMLAGCLFLGSALADGETLRSLALLLGLEDGDGFAETIEALRREGDLPAYYVTKDEAKALGWRPGDDLCRSAPGHVIGGDRFGNREGRLPDRPGRHWREADLDFACGRRGARRLVYSDDGLVFVTLDHYETFHEIPAPANAEAAGE